MPMATRGLSRGSGFRRTELSGMTGRGGDGLVGELQELDDDSKVAVAEPVAVRLDGLGKGLVERPEVDSLLVREVHDRSPPVLGVTLPAHPPRRLEPVDQSGKDAAGRGGTRRLHDRHALNGWWQVKDLNLRRNTPAD